MLKKMVIVAGLLSGALALGACAEMEEDMGMGMGMAEGIAASNAQFEAAYAAGDAAAIAALYTEDGAVLPPDSARIDGREGIQAMWQSFIDAGVTDFHLQNVELTGDDGHASEVGTFSIKAPDGKGGMVTVTGKYIVLWQKDADGVWRLHRDIWNDNPAG